MSSPRAEAPDTPATEPIEVAAGIGARLVDEAIWHERRCNWIGGRLGPGARGELVEHHAALDESLYEGTAGVALFLAELHAATGEPGARRAALGAIAQAVEATRSRGDASTPGLYVGSGGVALVAARLGLALEEPALVESARRLAKATAAAPAGPDEELDLLNGSAGTVVVLLALAKLLDAPELAEAALARGDGLLGAAIEDGGLSWPSRGITAAHNLTGLSHGAAGIALALLELGAATGEPRFMQAAERAFDYEQSTFDATVRNWPDYRELYPDRPSPEPGYASFWCHGGPGIALSRLTALERLGGPRWRAEAEAGLEVSLGTVVRALEHGGGNFSLCHGMAGNAEIVADGARVLGGRWERSARVVADVAALGAARHGAAGRWPCGVGSREAPGLMLGIAGIGRFYLRAAGVLVPSILRPNPDELGVPVP
jgi:lantibiotic modifying enzyme